jgi:hypothetical protein
MRDPRPPVTNFARYKTSDPREYYFNNVNRADVGKQLCPV